ncbi:MAG: type I restriction-modification enzyme R subunit C-terminal domain-containing protein [Candidatus Nanohaloarchaea archaeon]
MEPERKARGNIDEMLEQAGWVVQDRDKINLGASKGVAVREFPTNNGPADYLLFVNRKAVGVIEAKPEGTTLSGVEDQSEKYAEGFTDDYSYYEKPLPFVYESTGVKTYFKDLRGEISRSRRLFWFHQPETLEKWIEQEDTLRNRLRDMPDLEIDRLWDCQVEAIQGLEESLKQNKQKSLIQMATGSGKTYTAATESYRLIKHAKANRILFLVDRKNLGKNAKNEFQQFSPPGTNKKFTDLYNVQHLTSNKIDPVSKVCISTIQRLYSILKGEELDEEEEEKYSTFEEADEEEIKEVIYNSDLPIEAFDFIIIDECHRSIYNKWREVLEYFDSFLIGLTATPAKETLGFFDKNLVTEYSHQRAVADNVNVGYDTYRIKTRISEKGSEIESGFRVPKRDKKTREEQWEMLDKDVSYTSSQLDRDVVAKDQIRTVMNTFQNKLPEIFPNREEVPKTLIFAKDDAHAEDIVRITREVFGKSDDFCKKITYKSSEKPGNLISEFRNSYNPRIAVSVDMISTGTDIKPLECLIFMRNINSRTYFEQMKGRGTRTIEDDDLKGVTPDAESKDHFVIVDAVGVTESEKTDSTSMNRSQSVAFEDLMEDVARGKRDEDTLETLASRFSRMEKSLAEEQIEDIEEVAGESIEKISNDLLDAVDPDKQKEKAEEKFDTEDPTEEQIEKAREELTNQACELFDDPEFREDVVEIKKRNVQIIDTVSQDEVLETGFTEEEAENIVTSFEEFIEENKDEIDALNILYNQPRSEEHLTHQKIKELADKIEKPPQNFTPERVWKAYERLEDDKVKGANSRKLLTDIISLVKFATGQEDELKPFEEEVEERYREWLEMHKSQGDEFTDEQLEWLDEIKEHIATSGEIEKEELQNVPFNQKGGLVKAHKIFGEKLDTIIQELNEELVA